MLEAVNLIAAVVPARTPSPALSCVKLTASKTGGVSCLTLQGTDAETARGARRWNDANVLALGLRLTTPATGTEMLEAFLATDPDPSEAAEIAKLG